MILSLMKNQKYTTERRINNMTSFEVKREKYFKKIKGNKQLLVRIIHDNKDTEKGQEMLEVLLTPKNEKELSVAKILYSMVSDLVLLMDRYYGDELKEIPNEENEGLKTYIKTIKRLKNNEDIKEISKDETPEHGAKVLYDFIVASLTNSEGSLEYIAEESGFNLSDDLELAQFEVYMNKAKRIMEENNLTNKKYQDCSDEEIKNAKILAEEFHKCCEEGKKDLSNKTQTESITRQLTKAIMKAFDDNK